MERNSANFVLILSSQYCKKIQVYLTDQVGIGYRLYIKDIVKKCPEFPPKLYLKIYLR